MSDDTEPKALFDSTLKKKKKKKTKKAVDDDSESVENVPENESEEKPEVKPAKKKKAKSKAETPSEEPEPEDQTEAAAPLKKKKKKKKAFAPSDENEDETAETESKQTEDAPSKPKKTSKKQDADDQADDSFSLPEKKKKTKKKGVRFEGDAESTAKEEEPENNDEDNNRDDDDDADEDDDDEEDQLVDFGKKKKKKNSKQGGSPWSDSDRDYLYTELLERIFSLLNENNPELVKSKKTKYVIKPPEVLREGTKKTVWANFQEICDAMHRQSDHVLAYAQTELGTTASIDGNQRLVIKGRFQPKQIEIVVRHYIAEYVSCRTCKSPDTLLKKENRLYFLQCKSCGSTRTVASIKQGFVAQVGKRKHN